jgi:alpha-beta hydrolase superfamily lysophospholipase
MAVYTYDAHGHGLSEPKDDKHRCFIEHFEDLVDDALQYIAQVVTVQVPGKPLFIGGSAQPCDCAS